MTKQPSYRFANYAEPWEEKKLGEIIDINSGESPAKFHEGYTPYVKVDDLNYCDKYLTTTKIYVDTNKKIKKIEKGSIVFPKRGAAILTNKIRILNTEAYMDTNMMSLSTDKSNLEFLYTVISNVGLYKIADTSTIPQINNKHILPYIISLPSLPEQIAIGSFFQDIDQLISLQQRKLEVLKEQKKTYLKLLFPAKGQTKPALRFAGFEDEWKEVKLGEVVASERKGKAKSEMIGNKSVYLDTIYLNGGEQTRVDCDCDTSKEDIIILWDGSQAGAVYYGFEGALGSTLKSYKIFGSGSFYYQQMKASQSLIFERYRTPNIPHVIKSFLDDFYIFTTSLPEQEVIGSFFQDLDKAIAKQEEKVNQLKESKQTLLRKMFI